MQNKVLSPWLRWGSFVLLILECAAFGSSSPVASAEPGVPREGWKWESFLESGINPDIQGLIENAWNPSIRLGLTDLLFKRGKYSTQYDASRPPLAVFDVENTLLYGDLSEVFFLYLVDEMAFSFDANFWLLIPKKYRSRLRTNYADAAAVDAGSRRQDPAFFAYRKGLVSAYFETCDSKGRKVCSGWISQLLTGLTPERVKSLGLAMLKQELARAPGFEMLLLGATDLNPIQVQRGIRFFAPMVGLIKEFQASGFEVWLASESPQWLLETVAQKVDIPVGKVLGSLPSIGSDGKVSPVMKRIPYRKSKLDLLKRAVSGKLAFSAGESLSDFELFEATDGVRLVIDNGRPMVLQKAKEKGWMLQSPFLVKVNAAKK